MIEIAVLIFGTRSLIKTAQARGYSGFLAAAFPVAWIVCEIFGAVVTVIATNDTLIGMVGGLVCAAIGGGIVAVIINSLPYKDTEDLPLAEPTGSNPEAVAENVWSS